MFTKIAPTHTTPFKLLLCLLAGIGLTTLMITQVAQSAGDVVAALLFGGVFTVIAAFFSSLGSTPRRCNCCTPLSF